MDRFGQMALEWLEWTTHTKGIYLQRKLKGKVHVIGKRHIRVDRWDAESETVHQFHGRLFHGHNCHKKIMVKLSTLSTGKKVWPN